MPIQIQELIRDIGDVAIAHNVTKPIDAAAFRSPVGPDSFTDFPSYKHQLGVHYNVVMAPVLNGGRFSDREASSRGVRIVDREHQERGGSIVSAFQDAQNGINGGISAHTDMITQSVKREATESYVNEVFDRYVTPNSWDEKVEIIRQFIARCGMDLGADVDADHPERYAQEYLRLIRTYVAALQRNAATIRRL